MLQWTPAIKIFGEIQTLTKTSDVAATISVSNIGVSGSETYRQFVASATKPLVGGTSSNSCVITKNIYNLTLLDLGEGGRICPCYIFSE